MQCLSNDHRYCRNGILIPLDHINSDTSVSIYHKKKRVLKQKMVSYLLLDIAFEEPFSIITGVKKVYKKENKRKAKKKVRDRL